MEKRFEFIVRIQAQRAQPVTAINLNSDAGHSFLNDRFDRNSSIGGWSGRWKRVSKTQRLKNPRAQEFPLVAISLNAKGQPGPDQPPIFHPSTCGGGRHESVADLHSLPLPLNFRSPAHLLRSASLVLPPNRSSTSKLSTCLIYFVSFL